MNKHEQPTLFPEDESNPGTEPINTTDYTTTETAKNYRPRYPEVIGKNAGEIINEMVIDLEERIDEYEPSSYHDLGYTDHEKPTVSKNELVTKLREAGHYRIYNDILNNRLGNLFVRLNHFESEVLQDQGIDENERRMQEVEDFNKAAQEHGLPSAYSFMQLAYLMDHYPEH